MTCKRIFLTLLVLFTSNVALAEESRSVQVKAAKLRSDPKAWARGIADVVYGDRLALLETQKDWLRVRTGSGVEGFVHQSAVTPRLIVLSGKPMVSGDMVADSPDIYLAGKGFNAEVELELASKDATLNFGAVDFIEKASVVPAEELLQFIRDGKLREGDQ